MCRRTTSARVFSQNTLSSPPRHLEPHKRVLFRYASSVPPTRRSKSKEPRVVSTAEFRKVKRLTMNLVDRAAKEPSGWKHTPSHRGEERRLLASLQNASSIRGPSMEKAKYDADADLLAGRDNEESITLGLLPLGTFVETRRKVDLLPPPNLVCTHGIVVGDIVINRRQRIGILTSTGEIWWPVREDIHFVIPSIAPLDLIKRCGDLEESVPSKETEILARIEVLKRLRDIERIMDGAYNLAFRKSTRIYDTIKSPDPNRWSQIIVTDVARLTNPNPDIYHVFATHKYMMNHPTEFVASQSYETTQKFSVRPQSHIDEIQTVQKWLRVPDGPIQSFAQKAQRVIQIHKTIQAKSRGEKPSQSPAQHSWSTDDKTLLGFLQHSLRQTRTSQSDPYSLGRSTILKAIYPKSLLVTDQTVHEILVDLGVFAPWQDLASLTPELDLDHEPEAMSAQVKAQDELVLKVLSSPPKDGPLGPEDFYPSDPLQSVRHDFGDMPVFVIDEAQAEELDDGVSVERIPSEPGHSWVHIHVADPASVIPPTHILTKQAAVRDSTAYFIQRSWPLFPRRLINDAQHGLSLGSRVGLSKRVLTFSAKVNTQGEIVDSKVRAGIVRNIRVVTYDDVDTALGFSQRPAWYPYGRDHSKPISWPQTLTECQIRDLRDLSTISDCIVAKRQREGVFVIGQPVVDISNIIRAPSDIWSPTLKPTTFRGFPTFQYRVMDLADADSGSHAMVAELMKLASRVASRFCMKHEIPALRRVSDGRQMRLSTGVQTLLKMRSRNNYVRHDNAAPFLEVASTASYSLEPLGHFSLGVPDGEGYIRATSPLRRYLDLVHHWQIHHALLGSSASSIKPPPFSSDDLTDLAISVGSSERLHKIVQKNHNLFWQIMLLKRWADDTARGVERHDDPLQNLDATTMVRPALNSITRKFHCEVHIRILGMRAMLENLDDPDIPLGSRLPVKILETRLGVRPLFSVILK